MVQASATKEVPLGYVCGYPLGRSGGELYGGSMFCKSAANEMPQGLAIHKINKRWAVNSVNDGKYGYNKTFQNWEGRENIGIPVCKKKYAPFDFHRKEVDGHVGIEVVRMYGCRIHSGIRQNIIAQHGPRKGWEPFGQWSMKKAKKISRKFAMAEMDENSGSSSSSSVSSDDEKPTLKQLCNNGQCAWKMKHKYDDVVEELESTSNKAN